MCFEQYGFGDNPVIEKWQLVGWKQLYGILPPITEKQLCCQKQIVQGC
jgi:hypothetical protein